MSAPPTVVDLNRVWVDSPVRGLAQRRFELRQLTGMAGALDGTDVLDVGCGRRGTALRELVGPLGAASATGLELHEASVEAARRATADLPTVEVHQGDARDLAANSVAGRSYDVVLLSHVLHHSPDWRTVLHQAASVLGPGGRLLSCEMTARFVDSRLLRAVSYHPADGDRPTEATLRQAVLDAGLTVVGQRGLLGWWTALAARRA
jgi:2-polyprenyl-3-methyl-5-hydroxy-6-metoxy-1,4-benzoquinol methylase